MSIVNHKYFDPRAEAQKKKEERSSEDAADPAGALKMDTDDNADDVKLHATATDAKEGDGKAASVTPSAKEKNPKKKAKK